MDVSFEWFVVVSFLIHHGPKRGFEIVTFKEVYFTQEALTVEANTTCIILPQQR